MGRETLNSMAMKVTLITRKLETLIVMNVSVADFVMIISSH